MAKNSCPTCKKEWTKHGIHSVRTPKRPYPFPVQLSKHHTNSDECTPAELILKQQPTSHFLLLMVIFVTCNYGEATAQEGRQIIFWAFKKHLWHREGFGWSFHKKIQITGEILNAMALSPTFLYRLIITKSMCMGIVHRGSTFKRQNKFTELLGTWKKTSETGLAESQSQMPDAQRQKLALERHPSKILSIWNVPEVINLSFFGQNETSATTQKSLAWPVAVRKFIQPWLKEIKHAISLGCPHY